MYKNLIYLLLSINFLHAQNIDTLLEEYELNTRSSLKTVDEKLGHVTIYSQKDLRLMQYTTLSDLLKEFPLSNLNKNKLGTPSFSLPGSKTDVSGFFRFFINDHEVTSNYTQAPSSSWIDLPVDLIDYIEIYRGNSSFALGSENGIFFIRIYTKKPSQQNGSQLFLSAASHGSSSQSFSHAETFENGWGYLAYLNISNSNDSTFYKTNKLHNDSEQRYFYLSLEKDTTQINLGYTDIEKDNYVGMAMDGVPDNGNIKSRDYFIDLKKYFLDDSSLKVQISYDRNEIEYKEADASGIGVIPLIDLANIPATLPKEYDQSNNVTKLNGFVSKSFSCNNNNLLLGLNFQEKKYNIEKNISTNFAGITTQTPSLSNFNKEQVGSILLQDDYKLNEKLLFVVNGKFDKTKRNGGLEDLSDEQYRLGAIYTPFENFGLKAFYTKTYITPSFFNIDYAREELKPQEYKYFTLEGVYAKDNSRLSVLYNDVKIRDFLYYSPVGFITIDHTVKTSGFIFDYTYEFSSGDKVQLNYFTTELSETMNNSSKGGYIKYMGSYGSFEYFSSIIYRNGYKYLNVDVDDSFNFSLGTTYNISKNTSISLKGENLFDNSTESLYKEGLLGNDFAMEDYQREVTLSMKWVF